MLAGMSSVPASQIDKENLMSTQNVTTEKNQYALWQILGIWLMASAPMWILGWIVCPAMSIGLSPVDAGLLRIKLLTVGLIWEFVLAMIILYFEEGNIRLSTISRRFWLNHPVSARTGETEKSLWWWIVPLIVLVAFLQLGFRSKLLSLWAASFPFFAEPIGYDMSSMFTPELRAQVVGAWGWLALIVVYSLFNTVLGEELLFRGVLLPKMEGVFGKWDWLANGVIFGFYHLHQPWNIPSSILTGLIYAFSAKRFRSNWMAVITHGAEGILMLVTILTAVLGMKPG